MSTSAREAFLRGAHLFDRGAFFEAHEAWEERWRAEPDTGSRRLFQGLIQVAAGFHKLRAKRDPAAAGRLLTRGLAKLEASLEGAEDTTRSAWMAQTTLRGFCDGVRAWKDALDAPGTLREPPDFPHLGG